MQKAYNKLNIVVSMAVFDFHIDLLKSANMNHIVLSANCLILSYNYVISE